MKGQILIGPVIDRRKLRGVSQEARDRVARGRAKFVCWTPEARRIHGERVSIGRNKTTA